jgi:type IV secretion system protein VirB4
MWSERMSVTRKTSIVRREFIASRRIPFSAHVGAAIITTSAGDFIQTFRLAGASFESADDETLNYWHERLNVTWRNIASPNISLWSTLLGGGTLLTPRNRWARPFKTEEFDVKRHRSEQKESKF